MLSPARTLRTVSTQIKTLERQIAGAVHARPGRRVFTSLLDQLNSFITSADVLPEMGDRRARYPQPPRSPAARLGDRSCTAGPCARDSATPRMLGDAVIRPHWWTIM